MWSISFNLSNDVLTLHNALIIGAALLGLILLLLFLNKFSHWLLRKLFPVTYPPVEEKLDLVRDGATATQQFDALIDEHLSNGVELQNVHTMFVQPKVFEAKTNTTKERLMRDLITRKINDSSKHLKDQKDFCVMYKEDPAAGGVILFFNRSFSHEVSLD